MERLGLLLGPTFSTTRGAAATVLVHSKMSNKAHNVNTPKVLSQRWPSTLTDPGSESGHPKAKGNGWDEDLSLIHI